MTESGWFFFHPLAVICTYLQLLALQLPRSSARNAPRAMLTDAPAGAVLVGNTVVGASVVGGMVLAGEVVAVVALDGAVEPVDDIVDEVLLDPPTASVLGCVTLLCDALVQPTSSAAAISAGRAMRGMVRMGAV